MESSLLRPCDLCRGAVPGVPIRHGGWHRDLLRELILGAKWHGRATAIPLLADWCVAVARIDDWADGLDAWCPVPRDPWRVLCRGHPLSEDLGSEIGRRLGLPRLAPPRRRRRPPQARLDGTRRRRNLRGAFVGSRRLQRRVAGRSILVVDDVTTTGTTLRELAAALDHAGAHGVKALVAAASV